MYDDQTLKNPGVATLRTEQLRAMIRVKPQILASHLAGMSKKQQDNFKKLIESAFEAEEKEGTSKKDHIDEVRAAFTKATSMTSLMSAPSAEEPETKKEEGGEEKNKK